MKNLFNKIKQPFLNLKERISRKVRQILFRTVFPESFQRFVWEALLFSQWTYKRRDQNMKYQTMRKFNESIEYLFHPNVIKNNAIKNSGVEL
jgi:hypothetical protein